MLNQKVLMFVENHFPYDFRVRNEAYTLTKEGYRVTVISYKNDGDKTFEIVNGVYVYRIPRIKLFKKNKREESSFLQKIFPRIKSVVEYIFEYIYFTFVCFIMSLHLALKEGVDIFHAHNPPDTLFLIGAFYKLFGKKFVFDHHDLSPELYLTRFSGKKDIIYKILILLEKLSCRLADVIICTNNSYKQIVMNRHNINANNIYIVRNNPVFSEFLTSYKAGYNQTKKETDKKILLYLGSINPQDSVDLLLHSLHYLVNDLNEKNIICYLIGDGDSLQSVKKVANELCLMDYVEFKGFISEREKIIEYLSLSDICIEPASDNELNRHSTFIKIMEYMAVGKPIVAYDLTETRYSANGGAILVPPGDIKAFAKGIKQLVDNSQLRRNISKAGLERIEKELNWEKGSLNLIGAYKALSF